MSSRLSTLFAVVLLALLGGCSTLVSAPAAPASSAATAQAAWARVLATYVNERGEVDFDALAGDRRDLDRVVRYVADTPLNDLPDEQDRLAHMINAYNALSMYNVLASGIPATHAGWNKVSFFFLRRLEVGGQAMSLYSFENDVIRPFARARADPRVHFALNCSGLSCPVLPRVPFTGKAIDTELERESRAFFTRPENLRVDPATRTVWFNEILRFYTEDFVPVPARSLVEYANRYVPQPIARDYAVRFTPYDWTIANSRRPR